jgi:xanthine dehydrogenase accessory factor
VKSLLQIIRRVTALPANRWALATLVRTRGSTYRRPGARLLVGEDGATTGVLSGGCLEKEIARCGQEVIANGTAQLLSFDVRKLYGCDGQVDILIEPLPCAGSAGNLVTEIGERLRARERCCVATLYEGQTPGSWLLPKGTLTAERAGLFLHTLFPPQRLLLFGHGPEIEPLTALCETMGWETVLLAHPEELTADFVPDEQTAAVVMTHHFGRDLLALSRLSSLGLPYIGLLGPKRRSAELMARLHESMAGEELPLAALHFPAGLDIGSEAPEEIALSIVSEISAVFAGRCGGFLRDRREPIHLHSRAALQKSA